MTQCLHYPTQSRDTERDREGRLTLHWATVTVSNIGQTIAVTSQSRVTGMSVRVKEGSSYSLVDIVFRIATTLEIKPKWVFFYSVTAVATFHFKLCISKSHSLGYSIKSTLYLHIQ